MSRSALFIPSTRGMGHVVRSRALANELCERGWSCSTSGGKRPPGFKGDVVVVDGDGMDPNVYDWPCKVVAIQDAPRDHRRCTFVVRPSAGLDPQSVPGHLLGKMMVGSRFALIRREFIAMSGINPGLCREDGQRPVWDARFVKDLSAETVALCMVNAAVVITYGGMRAMEAACVGVPMVVLARNEGELLNAQGLARAGAAKHVAEDDQVDDMVAKMLRYPQEKLRAMSDAGRALVDGRGCQRVADAIEEEVGA